MMEFHLKIRIYYILGDKAMCTDISKLKEYIMEVANDCVKKLSSDEKAYISSQPTDTAHHFEYCMYIRNHYIYPHDFTEYGYLGIDPDTLSSQIMNLINSLLLTEADTNKSIKSR